MSTPLRARREALEELWQQGLSGHELLRHHTDLVDSFIREQYESSAAVAGAGGQIAIIALGGYGRRELYPFSDVDLLLLHDRRAGKAMREVSEALLYPLWDGGFDVGHSVRTIKDACAFALEDFIFQVSLLDARLVVGSAQLFEELMDRYRKKVFDRRRHAFVETMEQFRRQRREKYGSHAYLLEPHIKEGKGGMRDIQAMLWVARGVFGLNGLDDLEGSGMLEADDRRAFDRSWNMLARIRNRLHYIRRRKDDQLVFEFQEEMAEAFGFADRDGMLGVEHFMREVYGNLQTIAVVTDLFFEHVHEVLGLTGGVDTEEELEHAISLRSGTVRLAPGENLEERAYLLMRLFLQSGRTGKPLHHRTRKTVSQHLHLITDAFRSSRKVARVFFETLMESREPLPVLESMLATGLLYHYIPEFAGVESLAQHDMYHIYTVDRHSAQTVAELARLREEQAELMEELSRPHLLYLAALLHDVGKGRHRDHSELGSVLVAEVGRRLGLKREEQQCLGFLVLHHLYLPENALRRDLDDPEFIRQAAELLVDEERLTMLYLLTIADSRATGPSAWSSWKASLLAEFYLKVKSCMAAGCIVAPVDQEAAQHQGVAWLREQVCARLEGHEPPEIAVEALPEDYLMSFTPEMVLFHLHVHREQAGRLQQQVLLFPEAGRESWPLLLMSRDRPGLLAKFCGVLALYNLKVRSAQIFTWPDGTVVDVINVAPSQTREFDEMDWQGVQKDLNRAISYRLDLGSRLHSKQQPYGLAPGRQVQQLIRKVVIDNSTSQQYTILEIYGGDSPVILYKLTQLITDYGLDIHRARIATEVEQLIDVFYVQTRAGGKLTDAGLRVRLHDTLLQLLWEDSGEEQPELSESER